MPRWWMLASAIGCHAGNPSSELIEGGAIIAMREGQQRTVHLTAPSTLVEVPARFAAHIENGTELVLRPDCTTVLDIDAAPTPRLFVLELAPDGGADTVPLVVEVLPSVDANCRPSLVACIQDGPCGAAVPASQCAPMMPGSTRGLVTGTRIDISYLGSTADGTGIGSGSRLFSDPSKPDAALTFELINPGLDVGAGSGSDNPSLLFEQISTDAPIHFGSSHDTVCQEIPNTNVVGTFTLDYVMAHEPDANAVIVAAGAYQFLWNQGPGGTEPYGLELVSCATPTVCAFPRSTPASAQWCVARPTGSATSLVFRVWASQPGMLPMYMLQMQARWLSSPNPVDLISETERRPTTIQFKVDATIRNRPLLVSADLGTVENDVLVVSLRGFGTSGQTGYDELFTRAIPVGTTCQ